jgi:endonuclease/exonuclease/phosphatase (EEP) superfamily protein YafD
VSARAASSGNVRRAARVLPFLALLLLLGAWALCAWGRDESLIAMVASHVPGPLYCTLALCALLASVFARSLPAGLAALACLAIAVFPLGVWTTPSVAAAPLASQRVLSWNVEQWNRGGARLGRAVFQQAPDLFCLQEAKNHNSFPGDVEWVAFEAELPGYHLIRHGDMAFGTRWEVVDQWHVKLHDELWRRPMLDITVRTPQGALLRVIVVHFVHTGYYGKRPSALTMASAERLAQAERILARLGSDRTPTIVCGDFNAPENSAVLARLRERLSDAWLQRGHGFGFTSSSLLPLRRIDYLLTTGIDVGEIEVLDWVLSDHRPLWATFGLEPGRTASPEK